MRTYWCRHADCQQPYHHPGGNLPQHCPECYLVAAWATEAGQGLIAAPPQPGADPEVQYELTFNDKRFLHALRIEWREEPDPSDS